MCEIKACYVGVYSIQEVVKEHPYIPRLVSLVKPHKSERFLNFDIHPPVKFSELNKYKQRRVRKYYGPFHTFDSQCADAVTEEEFRQRFVDAVKEYHLLIVLQDRDASYLRSFVTDKMIVLLKHFGCSCGKKLPIFL
jgi:hypothetical protein